MRLSPIIVSFNLPDLTKYLLILSTPESNPSPTNPQPPDYLWPNYLRIVITDTDAGTCGVKYTHGRVVALLESTAKL